MKKREGRLPDAAAENAVQLSAPRRGRVAVALSAPYAGLMDDYAEALRPAPLSEQTRRTYASKVRQYLAWLATVGADGGALQDAAARDRAVLEYRNHLEEVLERKPATVNNALAAVDDLYVRLGMGPASAPRAEVSSSVPRALSEDDAARFVRAVDALSSPRDAAIALVPFYAGARIAEIVGLDLDDVRLSTRGSILRIHGRGGRVRELPVHSRLRAALSGWLAERANWPGADGPELFLNRRGERLSVRGAHDVITATSRRAGLDDDTTALVLRHTLASRLARRGTSLVVVAELLGHARLETTRRYTRPTREEAVEALGLLDIDR